MRAANSTLGHSLRGELAQWYARPALVTASPHGMPLHGTEYVVARDLARHDLAVLISINGKHYLQPLPEQVPLT